MKILLVNKFLYIKGGAETYVFKLGELLEKQGHSVQYFGCEHKDNIVGNNAESYVHYMDFGEGVRKNLLAPFRIIYSGEARKKLRKVLYDFNPDVIHLNNIQFHLTPSIILEAHSYRKKTGRRLKIVYTAHDYQLICPSHGLFDSNVNVCEKCLGGNYTHCFKTKCVKNSRAKSLLAMLDAYLWKFSRAYSYIDTIICPSAFLKSKLDIQKRFSDKTVTLHNFIQPVSRKQTQKEGYVLEFGHLCRDKGTYTLLEVAKRMQNTRFLFAGYGEAEKAIQKIPNAQYVGFKKGEELEELIRKAALSVYPSQWYENCPFSVIESQMYGTPVIGSRMGGIPELIDEGRTGLLFESGNADELMQKLSFLLDNPDRLEEFTKNCDSVKFETPETYYNKLIRIYEV